MITVQTIKLLAIVYEYTVSKKSIHLLKMTFGFPKVKWLQLTG